MEQTGVPSIPTLAYMEFIDEFILHSTDLRAFFCSKNQLLQKSCGVASFLLMNFFFCGGHQATAGLVAMTSASEVTIGTSQNQAFVYLCFIVQIHACTLASTSMCFYALRIKSNTQQWWTLNPCLSCCCITQKRIAN